VTEITHERCSELLRFLESGKLGASEAAAVEAHLASCDECARELAGLRSLTTGPGVMMSEEEKKRLHEAIRVAIRDERAPRADVVAASSNTALRRIWPSARVLAAAAVIVAGFVFATNIFPNDDETAGPARQAVSGGGAGKAEAASEGEAPTPVFAAPAGTAAVAADQAEGAATEQSPTPEQALRAIAAPAPPYSLNDLNELAQNHRPFTEFAKAYTVQDADRLGESFLDQLASSAPTKDLSAAVQECGSEKLRESPGPILPAFAAYDRVRGSHSLILGFVSSGGDSGPLDQFSLWVYAGTDCGVTSYSSSGSIRART
jgi:anti-sigma factor RsiW